MLRSESRGFFTVDFMLALTVILMIFSSVYLFHTRWVESTGDLGKRMTAGTACQKISGLINTAYALGGENCSLRFVLRLPETTENIFIENGFLVIRVNGFSFSLPLLYDNVVISVENHRRPISIEWDNKIIRVRNT